MNLTGERSSTSSRRARNRLRELADGPTGRRRKAGSGGSPSLRAGEREVVLGPSAKRRGPRRSPRQRGLASRRP
jgi:hypothetical protein